MKKIGTFRAAVFIAAMFAGTLAGCTTDRLARDISKEDFRISAHYEAETTHESVRTEGRATASSWFNFLPSAQDTGGGYYSDVGSLFSGLSPTQSLALRAAIADACEKSGADFLLLPRYNMKTKSYWFLYESVSCSVSVFPVKVVRIKRVE